MYAQIYSATLQGIGAELVVVEADLARGLPSFSIVGLPDAAVKEARERIRAAITNSGFVFPAKRITVNLSPANTRKEGTHLDLPIAISLLVAGEEAKSYRSNDYAFLGELSLDGRIKPIKGALSLAVGLRDAGIKKLMVPMGNVKEIELLSDIKIYPAEKLKEIADHISGDNIITGRKGGMAESIKEAESITNLDDGDFHDVVGQEGAKRAFEISAAAGHSMLMIGPPGSGKTMMARRMPGILPEISNEDRLVITQIYGVAEKLPLDREIVGNRPFRAPHHTISAAAFAGGGRNPKPGEFTLAHKGVLFLDELPEFKRSSLEALRQPMEDKRITINRMSGNVTYPADFLLLAACNPCPCGFFGDPERICTCSQGQIRGYMSKISGPLMDRIDLHVEVKAARYEDLSIRIDNSSTYIRETTGSMRNRVKKARLVQKERYTGLGIELNSQMDQSHIKRYCIIDDEGEIFLMQAFHRLGLSARAYGKILTIARTIADLDGVDKIGIRQIAEAVHYRCLDRIPAT